MIVSEEIRKHARAKWRSAVEHVPPRNDSIAQAERDLRIPESASGRGIAGSALRKAATPLPSI